MYRLIAGVLALLVYIPLRNRIIVSAVGSVSEDVAGDFMTSRMYIACSRPVILLSLLGV